jgi:hypothetical protein
MDRLLGGKYRLGREADGPAGGCCQLREQWRAAWQVWIKRAVEFLPREFGIGQFDCLNRNGEMLFRDLLTVADCGFRFLEERGRSLTRNRDSRWTCLLLLHCSKGVNQEAVQSACRGLKSIAAFRIPR